MNLSDNIKSVLKIGAAFLAGSGGLYAGNEGLDAWDRADLRDGEHWCANVNQCANMPGHCQLRPEDLNVRACHIRIYPELKPKPERDGTI